MPTGSIVKINKSKTMATGFINADDGSYPIQIPFNDIPLPADDIHRGDRVAFTFHPGTRTVKRIDRKL